VPPSQPVSAIGRRSLVPGIAVATTGLAAALGVGMTQFGPRWGDGAPVRPLRPAADPLPHPPSVPPSPALLRPVLIHSAALRQDWLAFRHLYVTPEGRVIDTGNGHVSHSEGQGWGLLVAQAADDPDTFARILEWTTRTLQGRPGDTLHAWRYRPSDANPVSDLNNATDGDLYIAAALARAAARWNRPDYAAQGARLARDVLGLVRTTGARTVLLPGATGFDRADCLVLNLSYYTFGLFPDLAALAPSPLWQTLRDEGAALMLQARTGAWMLPPDWLRLDRKDGALSIAPGWPPRFSWDAIRVPLHLAWGRVQAEPLFDSFRRYWSAGRGAPAWADLVTGDVAPYAAPAGIRAVAAIALKAGALDGRIVLPSMLSASDYYGAGLVLLSRLAMEEAPHSPG
jgi:endo-1,4-beta-D-glucanase Y